MERSDLVHLIQEEVARRLAARTNLIPLAVSNRHLHLCEADCLTLFGAKPLTKLRDLSQPGEFAAQETVTLVGLRGVLEKVRVLGPLRRATQVELSRTDAFRLGVEPPVRDSGNHEGSAGLTAVGPCGSVTLTRGVILAQRHIHMTPEDAARLGVADREIVEVRGGGERSVTLGSVLVRVSPKYKLELHLDTDEANAGLFKDGDLVELLKAKA
ncbi:MAG TPA: phosphate propanoyltransferase [Symbiobacteriaceae bacterium]